MQQSFNVLSFFYYLHQHMYCNINIDGIKFINGIFILSSAKKIRMNAANITANHKLEIMAIPYFEIYPLKKYIN